MRRILLAAAVLVMALMAADAAWAQHGHHGHGHGGHGHHGGHHHVGHWGGGHHHHGHWHGGYRGYGGYGYGGYGWSGIGLSIGYRPYWGYDYCYPGYGYGGYVPSYYYPRSVGYYGYYGSVYNPQANFAATTPAAVLNLVQGQQDKQRLIDLVQLNRARPANNEAAADAVANRPVVNVLGANIVQRRKAEQHIATGDVLFGEQKFQAALARYKTAAQLDPQMAEAYWRQGHALIATANYELAGGAFKRALALDPDTGRDGFSLARLYGDATITKTAHIESLAGWALEHAQSSEPYFLMGVTLHYDGQAERAAPFFARAAAMAGQAGGHVAAFKAAAPAEQAAPVVAPAAERAAHVPAPEVPVFAATEI